MKLLDCYNYYTYYPHVRKQGMIEEFDDGPRTSCPWEKNQISRHQLRSKSSQWHSIHIRWWQNSITNKGGIIVILYPSF